jgi:lipopolysaccharide export LptBFGC system permease protein LptF
MWIVIAAAILQVLLAVDQELIIPRMIPTLMAKHEEIYAQQLQNADSRSYPIQAMQDGQNGLLFAGKFTPAAGGGNAMMYELDVIERDENLQPVSHTTAASAEWDARHQQWKLTRGRRATGLSPQQDRVEKPIAVYKSDVTPDEIALYHSSEFVGLLSLQKINQLIERKQAYGVMDLLRVKHFRLSQLVLNIVMLLVAIPCVMTRDPSKLKLSIVFCLVLMGLCMASYFLAYQLAAFPPPGVQWADRWPAILAFAPILIFGVVAVYLLDRLPT